MFTMERNQKKRLCRLCYYETTDITEIFSERGKDLDYEGKINKYLYLHVAVDDAYPKTICWMCSQQLETFHKFFEKINEIQKTMLEDDYESIVLRPTFGECPKAGLTDIGAAVESVEEDDNMVELLYVSDEYGFEHEISENFVAPKEGDEPAVEVEIVAEEAVSPEPKQLRRIPGRKKIKKGIKLETGIDEKTGEETIVLHNVDEEGDDTTQELDHPSEEFITPDTHVSNMPRRRTRSSRCLPASVQPLAATIERRSRKSTRDAEQVKKEHDTSSEFLVSPSNETSPRKRKRGNNLMNDTDCPQKTGEAHDIMKNEIEGDSDDEFPARDSDNEDWPAQETLNAFPKEILRDGLLIVKGKQLMSIINKFYKLECESCKDKRRYKHLKELFEHYSSIHKEVGYVTCCQTKLSRYPAIIMHMARHIQPEPFKCDECGYMVTRPRFLERHKQTHLPEDQKPYACDQCSRRFCWKGALQIHLISHQPADERKLYVCHICGKVYDTPGGLSTHKKMIHSSKTSKESNVCHVCAKIFATRTGLHEHMSTIHQPREKDQMQCNECGKWLMNYRCLKTHMILHSDASFNCNICEYTTKKKVLLNRHMLSQHSDEKPFKCNLCEKSFKLKRALAVHMAKHGSTKTYKCPFCGRTFNSSTNFYTHRKSIHPEQWQEMRTREMETQRKKRIAAGVEEGEIAVAAEAHTNYVLTTESGEEITIINLKESEGDEINVPVSILDENGSIISTNTIVTRYPAGQSSV